MGEMIFTLGPEVILIQVRGNSVLFGNTSYGAALTDISGLKLNQAGVIKEFPDLEDKEDWKEQAIQRFKDKIKSLPSENAKMKYIRSDLEKHGYILKKIQKAGGRVQLVR